MVPEAEPKVNSPPFAWSDPPTVKFCVEETLPVGPIVKRLMPVELEIVRRFAVWFVTPMRFKVVEAACVPWRKTSEVEVAADAIEKFDPEKRKLLVELVKVKLALDVAPPPVIPKRTWESTPEVKVDAVEVENLFPLKSTSAPDTWRKPDKVRFVPEAFVKASVPIVEDGLRNSVDETTPIWEMVKKF